MSDALDAGVRRIHVDVMDGHFVPNLSMGPLVVAALRPLAERAGGQMEFGSKPPLRRCAGVVKDVRPSVEPVWLTSIDLSLSQTG